MVVCPAIRPPSELQPTVDNSAAQFLNVFWVRVKRIVIEKYLFRAELVDKPGQLIYYIFHRALTVATSPYIAAKVAIEWTAS